MLAIVFVVLLEGSKSILVAFIQKISLASCVPFSRYSQNRTHSILRCSGQDLLVFLERS